MLVYWETTLEHVFVQRLWLAVDTRSASVYEDFFVES